MRAKLLDQLISFVREYLIAEGVPCGRHCKDPVRFVPLYDGDKGLVGSYVCPQDYVSRVVYFSGNPDPKWFENYLSKQVGTTRVRRRDIRFGTRHGWELGQEAEETIRNFAPRGIKQYYWTFYPKTELDKAFGTFLCSKEEGGCGKIFTKPTEAETKLCPQCSK